MPDTQGVKKAARRMQRTRKNTNKSQPKRQNVWTRIWRAICWPFRQVAKLLRRFWNWLGGINLIAMTNLALLVAIIVLFSMLIIDAFGFFGLCSKSSQNIPDQITVTNESRRVVPRPVTLPLVSDIKTPVRVVPVKKSEIEIVKRQTAKQDNKLCGDVIIDSRDAGALIQNQTVVNGNLYLQNMRKYVLPCNVQINGNLFLRDVNMLQFCGEFTVTGNIYVSPRSSFGPLPKTARIGGHVII